MATITTEFGKVDTKKQRAVYLRLRDKKTEKRIATGIRVNESEISPKTKKIKNFEKAQAVEKLRAELLLKMTAMAPEIHYDDSLDASRIASSIVTKRKVESLDFFSFGKALTFNDSCFRIRPNGDGRGNNVIGIKKKPDLQIAGRALICVLSQHVMRPQWPW